MPKFDPNKNPGYIIFYAALISAVFTAAIMSLYALTKGTIERNELVMQRKAVVGVFQLGEVEGMSDREIVDTYQRRIVRVPVEGFDPRKGPAYYFAFEPGAGNDAEPFAYAFPIRGVGFWAPIEGLLAVDKGEQQALGVTFLQHSETPGLGGRITEQDFRRQWRGLDLSPPAAGEKFVYVTKTQPRGAENRHVDAISGATGTSTAVMNFTNDSIRKYMDTAEELARNTRAELEELARQRAGGPGE